MKRNTSIVIKPKTGWRDIDIKELFQYKDLIRLFVKRNFTVRYKQTVLGPAWLILSPLISTFISTFVFGTIAKIPSDGVPYFIFYMCGNTAWSYMSNCFTSTSSTFTSNSAIFGKVYFPRLVMPVSTVITALFDFAIQFVMFIGFLIYFIFSGAEIHPNLYILLVPVIIAQMAMLGLGLGIIVSSLTTKYRDLTVLVGFGVSLWMYVTPIIYSVSSLTEKLPEGLRTLCLLNPMAPVIEIFRFAFLGTGEIPWLYWIISLIVTVIILILGVVLFNRVEKTFMDTV